MSSLLESANCEDLREISEVFTDLPLPDDLAQRCREWQTKINLP